MRDRFGIFGTVIRIRKLSLLLVMMLRIPNNGEKFYGNSEFYEEQLDQQDCVNQGKYSMGLP